MSLNIICTKLTKMVGYLSLDWINSIQSSKAISKIAGVIEILSDRNEKCYDLKYFSDNGIS